ncbi:MAG: NAD+ synthase [Brachymonas sp.]|nr:NAD+ synthase [Brachymonas sp.]
MSLALAVLQTNPVAGDLPGNVQALAVAARTAYAQGARLAVTGAMAVCGAPLGDLAQRPAFVQACHDAVADLARQLADCPDLVVVTSHPAGIAVLRGGQAALHAASDEQPYVVEVQGMRVGVLQEPAVQFEAHCAGADVVCVLAASPWQMELSAAREQQWAHHAQQNRMPVIYANLVGGQDGRVFDGASFAVQADGNLAGRAAAFTEAVWLVRAQKNGDKMVLEANTAPRDAADGQVGRAPFVQPFNHAQVWQALVLGTRDYVRKSGFKDVLLGFSGGMDSALVLALAVDALGKEHVRTVMMPSEYTADISLFDAQDMALRLGVQHDVVPIAPLRAAFEQALAPLFAGRAADVTEENIQARVRGTLLMALSNKFGAMVLVTGNKSELSTGYCTLYGDMAGGFAPIQDVLKTQVYALARWRNQHDPFGTGAAPIPERIITRPPSAELRPDQTDQDSLPPYEVLDAIVVGYMEQGASVQQLLDGGLPPAAVQQVVRLIRINEYKRQQAAPGVCLSRRAYGCDWHYPLVNRFVEN